MKRTIISGIALSACISLASAAAPVAAPAIAKAADAAKAAPAQSAPAQAKATTASFASKSSDPQPVHYSKISYPEFAYLPPQPSLYRVALDKGVIAYLVPDTALALIQMSVFFGHPNLATRPDNVGAMNLYSAMLKSGGTKRFTPEQLQDSLEFVAASLSASLGDFQSDMGLDALRKDAYALFDLLPEVALRPRIDAEAFKVQKRTYLENIKHRYDTPRGVMAVAYEHVMYGPHPVGWLPTEKEVEAVTPATLRPYIGTGFAVKNMVIGVSGQFDRAEMVAQLNKLVAQMPDTYKDKADSVPPFRGAEKPGIYLVDKQAAQATIKMGAPGVKRPHPDYYPLLVASYIFGDGGFTSRLMEKVRSNEGLAYGVDSDVGSDYNRQATVGVSLQTKVETGAYAVKLVLEEMEKMGKSGITDAELQRAKDGLIKSLPSMFDTPSATARIFAQGEIWKRSPDHYTEYVQTLNRMTKAEVENSFRKYFNKDSMRIVVVGPKDALLKKDDRSSLSLGSLGPVKELTLKDIEARK